MATFFPRIMFPNGHYHSNSNFVALSPRLLINGFCILRYSVRIYCRINIVSYMVDYFDSVSQCFCFKFSISQFFCFFSIPTRTKKKFLIPIFGSRLYSFLFSTIDLFSYNSLRLISKQSYGQVYDLASTVLCKFTVPESRMSYIVFQFDLHCHKYNFFFFQIYKHFGAY